MATVKKYSLSKCIVVSPGPDFDTGIPKLIKAYLAERPKEAHPAIVELYGPDSVRCNSAPYRPVRKRKQRAKSYEKADWGSRVIVDGKLRCSTCHELLPLERFPVKRASRLGYDYRCKSCHAAYKAKAKERKEQLKTQ